MMCVSFGTMAGIARVFGRPQILEFIFDEEEIEKGEKTR
jgi:hypothetical protein